MGVPASEVGYTSATARSGDHESSYEHVVALGKKYISLTCVIHINIMDPNCAHVEGTCSI